MKWTMIQNKNSVLFCKMLFISINSVVVYILKRVEIVESENIEPEENAK